MSPSNRHAQGGTPLKHGNALLLLLLLFLTGAAMLPAQTVGKVSGVVRDAQTGEPLIGANVIILGTTLGASADVEGEFFILNVPPGRYDVQGSLLGYQSVVQSGVIVHTGRTTTTDFKLTVTALEGQEVVVQATRPDVEKEKTSTSAIIRSEEVQVLAGMRDVGDILGLAADVTDGHFRGGRSGEEYYTLQGMGIVNPLDNSSAFLPIMSAVEEVEVITSGFGAQYGNAQSGVVNISMKEGKRDTWKTRIESRTRAPGRKHFGPSVFDPGGNPYLALLLNSDFWRRGDPNADNAQGYWASMGSGLNSRFSGDTLVQVAVAQALWMQTRRDMNRNYGNEIDHSVEVATGGPVSDDMRMFVALRSNVEWPTFPTEQPDIERQVAGNIVADITGSSTLRISGAFNLENINDFPGSDGVSGYQRWLWDRITGIGYRKRTNVQLGARYTHTINPSTFLEVKLNSLFTRNRTGATPVPGSVPDSAAFGAGSIPWSFILPTQNNNSPDGLDYQTGYDVFRDEPTRTITLDGSFTSQLTKSHLLNAGIQLNSYFIDVSNNIQLRNNKYIEDYKARPFEAALYVQDKMEFEGMIANVGLRMDLWSSGRNYYTDRFLPFSVSDSNGVFHPDAASQKKSPVIGRLQPRIGVSFPVSVNTVFHLNYGAFMQRPSFQYVVSTRVVQGSVRPITLGNPRVEPEVTNSYDIGVTQGLGEGFTLDVSGYYKDVKNLIEQADFIDTRTAQQVSTYFNRDYADIRGFRVAVAKRRGDLTGSVNYQFSVATGKSATVSAATPVFTQDTTGAVTTDLTNVPIRDILLDFDRTHNVVLNLTYSSDEEWGPEILGAHLLGDVSLSANSFFRSGRPYTSPSNLRLINSARTPWEYNTNVRLTKRIRNFFGTFATIYVEVFNLFENKILNYDYVFDKPTPTNPNLTLSYYERSGIDDPVSGIRYWWDRGRQGPFAIDQSFLIYESAPRSFSFGIALEL